MEPQGKEDNNKEVVCSICSRIFSTNKNLKNHQLTIHEMVFPYKCSYPNCTKAYSIESRLKVHMRIHSGEKPFKCPICQKSFCEKGNLKTHLRFHSPNKPFTCLQCHKAYKTKGHLKDHIEVQHNGYKKYKCALCLKSFGRSSTLKAHGRTHTGEKNIKCPIDNCNHFFAEKGNMKMHYKRHLVRLRKEQCKLIIEDCSMKDTNLTNVNTNMNTNSNITRPCSNVTLLPEREAEENFKKGMMFVVNRGNNNNRYEESKNDHLDLIINSSSNLIDPNELIDIESNYSEELNCNSFNLNFPN